MACPIVEIGYFKAHGYSLSVVSGMADSAHRNNCAAIVRFRTNVYTEFDHLAAEPQQTFKVKGQRSRSQRSATYQQ